MPLRFWLTISSRHPFSARLWGAATTLREAIGAPREPAEQPKHEERTAQAREALGEVAFAAAFEEGRTLTLEQAIEYALGKE
jgi:hypothetical protein